MFTITGRVIRNRITLGKNRLPGGKLAASCCLGENLRVQVRGLTSAGLRGHGMAEQSALGGLGVAGLAGQARRKSLSPALCPVSCTRRREGQEMAGLRGWCRELGFVLHWPLTAV